MSAQHCSWCDADLADPADARRTGHGALCHLFRGLQPPQAVTALREASLTMADLLPRAGADPRVEAAWLEEVYARVEWHAARLRTPDPEDAVHAPLHHEPRDVWPDRDWGDAQVRGRRRHGR